MKAYSKIIDLADAIWKFDIDSADVSVFKWQSFEKLSKTV